MLLPASLLLTRGLTDEPVGLTGSSKAQHTAPRQGRDETFLMSVSENKNREVGMVLMSQRSATILVKQDALFSSLFLCTRLATQ